MTHSRSQPCSLFIAKKFDFRRLNALKWHAKTHRWICLLEAIHNCFCDTEMHYDPLTYCDFIGLMRVCILSRISRLKSEKYCYVSRESMMRKCCTVKHSDRFSNNPHLPLYLRLSPSDAMVSSTLKLKSLSRHIIIPCDLRVLSHAVIVRNPISEWFATTKMYFSLTQPVSFGLLCAIMEALPPCKCANWNMCFGPSMFWSWMDTHHVWPPFIDYN